jgi:hypothetical protein
MLFDILPFLSSTIYTKLDELTLLFKSVEELSELLHRLLNEGEMVIKWDRNIKNKGNAILSGLAA